MRDPADLAGSTLSMTIDFNRPKTAGNELDNIRQAIANAHTAGDGDFTRRCNAWLEARLDAPKALLTHSCTAALEMAALLFDLQPGDEVIMPSFTFVSTANAVVLRGAVPVFVDIRADTLNLDETLIEPAITPRTKAIFVVHYAGVGCAMDRIMDIAQRRGLLVAEDAAQGLLARYQGRPLGSHRPCRRHQLSRDQERHFGRRRRVAYQRCVDLWSAPRSSVKKAPTGASFLRARSTSIRGSMSALPTCRASMLAAAFFSRNWNRPTVCSSSAAPFGSDYHDGFAALEKPGPLPPPDCAGRMRT